MARRAEYVKDVYVDDPETGSPVRIELYRDPSTSKLFGVDGDFLEDSFNSSHASIEMKSIYSNTRVSIAPW